MFSFLYFQKILNLKKNLNMLIILAYSYTLLKQSLSAKITKSNDFNGHSIYTNNRSVSVGSSNMSKVWS